MDPYATRNPAGAALSSRLLSRLPRYAIGVAACGVAAAALLSVPGLGPWYLQRQDQWLLIAGALLLIACLRGLAGRQTAFDASWRLALAVGAAMMLATLAGHYWILSAYDLSADERLANFDAAILAKGQLVAPLPAQWWDHADALNTMYMFITDHREAWASAYLPVNAALRALVGWVAVPTLTGPLLTLLGALALWACARRIWPENREAAVVALLLYAGTGQIWLNGMTAYAMPAHLTVNLCWLWLVLRRRWWADIVALTLGLFAVGLHQIHYHPLFAAPILFLLLLRKEWGRAAFYALGYLAIGLFWQDWIYGISTLTLNGPLPPDGSGGASYFRRMAGVFSAADDMRFNMIANLFRMVTWQHLLLLPLFLLGVRVARRDRLAAALLGGIIVTLLARLAIQPIQGHGLGYRNTHGLIGNFILLAVYGWVSLGDTLNRWRPLLLRTTAASCLVLLPLQAWMSHLFYASFADVSDRIDMAPVDYVVIGTDDAPYSIDLVRNDPFLHHRPIRLVREKLDPVLQAQICAARPSIALVGPAALKPITAYFNTAPSASAEVENRQLAASLSRSGCRVEPL